MALKGGARRAMVEPVDIDALQGIFDRAVASKGAGAFKLGEYANKKATTAVSASGLEHNIDLVRELCEISNGQILAGQLKQCLSKYANTH